MICPFPLAVGMAVIGATVLIVGVAVLAVVVARQRRATVKRKMAAGDYGTGHGQGYSRMLDDSEMPGILDIDFNGDPSMGMA